MRNLLLGVCALAALCAAPMTASAQDPQAQPPQRPQPVRPTTHAPAPAGICTYSPGRALLLSVAGQSINAQLQAFAAAADTEFNAAQLESELEPYLANPESAPQALRDRYNAYRTRSEQINVTERQQKGVLGAALDFGPLAEAYVERNCAILFESSQYVPGYANPSTDMTPTLTQKLDAFVPQWPTFELITVEQLNAVRAASQQ